MQVAFRVSVFFIFFCFLGGCSPTEKSKTAYAAGSEREFPFLSDTVFPGQHADPERSDYIDADAPYPVTRVWEALTEFMIAQPCSTGPNNQLYCTRALDYREGICNLVALNADDGSVLWTDRDENGECQLDDLAWMTTPLVDVDGNVYAAGSNAMVSYTPDGELRWKKNHFSKLYSEGNQPNAPFGINMLPDGHLVMVTTGDGWVLVVDRATGDLVLEPYDLPSAKTSLHIPQPEGFMEDVASPFAAEVLWEIATGGSPYEIDNDTAIDPHSGLIFITGGGPAPNEKNAGGLWALKATSEGISTVFYVLMDQNEGGSGTTPTVSEDGTFVAIGDNDGNVMVVDIQSCLSTSIGNQRCEDYILLPIAEDVPFGASFSVSPENRMIVSVGSVNSMFAFDISKDEAGTLVAEQVWVKEARSTVVASFNNDVAYYATTDKGGIVAISTKTGETLFETDANFGANVTMAADGKTLITNNINWFQKATDSYGVYGWR